MVQAAAGKLRLLPAALRKVYIKRTFLMSVDPRQCWPDPLPLSVISYQLYILFIDLMLQSLSPETILRARLELLFLQTLQSSIIRQDWTLHFTPNSHGLVTNGRLENN